MPDTVFLRRFKNAMQKKRSPDLFKEREDYSGMRKTRVKALKAQVRQALIKQFGARGEGVPITKTMLRRAKRRYARERAGMTHHTNARELGQSTPTSRTAQQTRLSAADRRRAALIAANLLAGATPGKRPVNS